MNENTDLISSSTASRLCMQSDDHGHASGVMYGDAEEARIKLSQGCNRRQCTNRSAELHAKTKSSGNL